MNAGRVIRFARVDFRNDGRVFGIKDEDRFSHLYIIGKTGTGKSALIETMALQDLERGNGFALIDPHGDLVARIAARVPPSCRNDVIYLNATDPTQPYWMFSKKCGPTLGAVRMEHILRNVLIALLEQRNATLHDVLRMFSDNEFRKKTAKSLRNHTLRPFLLKEFERFSFGYHADGTAPIQNKL